MRIENSFIPVRGVGEATERRLWREGIADWDAFDPGALGGTRGERVADFIDVARDRLRRGDARFFEAAFPSACRWRLYEDFREEAAFLDIETTGLDKRRHEVTVVGLHRDGGTTTLVRGDDLSREALAAELADVPLLVTYNGARFDLPFLEDSLDVGFDGAHLDLVYPCRRVDLTGGLKAVERELGIGRDRPDLSGEDAVRLWREHERGDDGALETLIGYNRADTRNLAAVAEHVTGRLHDAVFEAARSEA